MSMAAFVATSVSRKFRKSRQAPKQAPSLVMEGFLSKVRGRVGVSGADSCELGCCNNATQSNLMDVGGWQAEELANTLVCTHQPGADLLQVAQRAGMSRDWGCMVGLV